MLTCLLCGGLIGAMQGWFVAFSRIPSFIVTLAGMLVFKGLAMTLRAGRSVVLFPDAFRRLSSGFIPDISGAPGLRLTSMALGLALAAALTVVAVRGHANRITHGVRTQPTPFFLPN